MKKESQNVISKYLNKEPITINSRLFSAQNRPRLYWTNLNINNIPEKDSELLIKDIIEDNVDESYYISEKRKKIIESGVFKQTGKIFNLNEKCSTLTAGMGMGGGVTPKININGKIRYITPLECERLQTLSDNYTVNLSKTQRYKTIGNGWTVDVISFILTNLN